MPNVHMLQNEKLQKAKMLENLQWRDSMETGLPLVVSQKRAQQPYFWGVSHHSAMAVKRYVYYVLCC